MYYNSKNTKILINGQEFFAKNATIQEQAAISPVYLSDKRHSTEYNANNGIGGSLKFSYYLTGQDYLKSYISDETTVISGSFGGLSFATGYLTTYAIAGLPDKTVDAAAEIVFFDELKGQFNPNYEAAIDIPTLNFADVVVSDPTNGAIGNLANLNSFSFNFTSDVKPKYQAGQSVPYGVAFGIKEISAEIETDNLSGFLPITGSSAGVQITLKHPQYPSLSEVYNCIGNLYNRQLETSAGNLLRSHLSIKQNNITDAPIITSITPTSGYANTSFLIQGSSFAYATNVYVNNTPANFSVTDDSNIIAHVPNGASSGIVTVQNFRGSVNYSSFNVLQTTITIDGVTPITGNFSQQIGISGSNFYQIDSIIFGNVTGTFSVIDENTINANVPNSGYWDNIRVVSSTRGLVGASPQKFVPVPEIYDFYPHSGYLNSIVTISGQGFSGVTGIYFNNLLASSTVNDNFTATAYVPSGNVKGYITLYGQSGVIGRSPDYYYPLADISGLIPASGNTGDAILIKTSIIYPELLRATTNNHYYVTFNGFSGDFGLSGNSGLSGFVPTGATSGPVSIYNNSLESYAANQNFILLNGPPSLSYAYPQSGATGNAITVYGTNLFSITNVSISGGSPTGSGIISPVPTGTPLGDAFSFQIPVTSGGNYNIYVTTPIGTTTGLNLFTALNAVQLSGFSPASGAPGNYINITGRNIYPFSKVYFNSTGTPSSFDISGFAVNYSSGRAIVPSNATSGLNSIIVDNTVTSGALSNYLVVLDPVISGFNPSSGDYGDTITATGAYLNYINQLKIGSYNIPIFSSNPAGNSMTFTVPTSGITDYVSGIETFGTGVSRSKFIINTPNITFSGFSPLSGSYSQTLIISGSNLDTVTGIAFSGNTAEQIYDNTTYSISGTSGIFTTIPDGIVNGKIRLYNSRSNYLSSNQLLINPIPTISGFVPSMGIYGDTVVVSGTNLNGQSFYFRTPITGQYAIAPILAYNGTTGVNITVPREIISGIFFASGNGSRWGNSPSGFLPLPTVSGFTPTGLLTGANLFITGINAYGASLTAVISGTDSVLRAVYSADSQDNTKLTGSNIIAPTGFSVFSGAVSSAFGGSGKLILVPSGLGNFTPANLASSIIGSRLGSMLSSNYLTINESAPTVSSFSPSKGNSSSLVTVLGSALDSVTGVGLLNGANFYAGTLNTATSGSLTFYPQVGLVQGTSGQVRVVSPFGSGASSSYFSVIQTPYLSGFTPTEGTTGTQVTITGSGMSGITGLYFGSYTGSYTVGLSNGSYALTGIVPNVNEALPAYYQVKVMSEAGQSIAGNLFRITSSEGQTVNGDFTVNGNLYAKGGFAQNIKRVSGNYSVGTYDCFILVNCTGALSIALTLPDAATVSGRVYHLKKIDSNAGNQAYFQTINSQVFDNSVTVTGTTTPYAILNTISDGSGWWMI